MAGVEEGNNIAGALEALMNKRLPLLELLPLVLDAELMCVCVAAYFLRTLLGIVGIQRPCLAPPVHAAAPVRVPVILFPAFQDAFVALSNAVSVAHYHADVALVGYAATQSHIAGALFFAPSGVSVAPKIGVRTACCHAHVAASHGIVDFSSDISDLLSPLAFINA